MNANHSFCILHSAFCILLAASAASAAPSAAPSPLEAAAELAAAGDLQGAANLASKAAADPSATPGDAAKALNASMNYFTRAKRPEVALPPLRLNSLFSDHAVFQRGMPIPVFGHATPCSYVTVCFNGSWMHTQAGEDGSFLVYLPAQEAGGPYTLEAYGDGASAKAEDIYVGEVWIAGGQSNMEMPLTGYGAPVPKEDYAALKADVPVRMLKVAQNNTFRVNDDCHAAWMTTWEGNEKVWSAAASFFAYAVARELKVPVGIVLCSYSGSRAEAWMSFGALHRMESRRAAMDKYEFGQRQDILTEDNHPAYSTNYGFADPAYAAIVKATDANPKAFNFRQPSDGREAPDFDDSGWKRVKAPGDWHADWHANGIVWHRKAVEIPAAWAGKELVLSLGAVDKQDVTYFNGFKVGATGEGFDHLHFGTPRIYKVPADKVAAGRAVIAVRALSFSDGAGFYGPAEAMKLSCPAAGGDPIPLAGEWNGMLTLNIDEREGSSRAYRHLPHLLADNMLSTVVPYAARGAIWYQGESNAGNKDYAELMEALIGDWRARWNQDEFAFYQVLLAGWNWQNFGRLWPEVRQQQVAAAKATGTGYASATDGGHANIHPPYKRAVGERLARCALADTYGFQIESHGPEFAGAEFTNGVIRVSFDHAAGLKAKGDVVGGFEVGDSWSRFTATTAKIEGETVVVSLPEAVKNPTFVRYAWKGDPADANLYNGDDLPAIPFSLKLK